MADSIEPTCSKLSQEVEHHTPSKKKKEETAKDANEAYTPTLESDKSVEMDSSTHDQAKDVVINPEKSASTSPIHDLCSSEEDKSTTDSLSLKSSPYHKVSKPIEITPSKKRRPADRDSPLITEREVIQQLATGLSKSLNIEQKSNPDEEKPRFPTKACSLPTKSQLLSLSASTSSSQGSICSWSKFGKQVGGSLSVPKSRCELKASKMFKSATKTTSTNKITYDNLQVPIPVIGNISPVSTPLFNPELSPPLTADLSKHFSDYGMKLYTPETSEIRKTYESFQKDMTKKEQSPQCSQQAPQKVTKIISAAPIPKIEISVFPSTSKSSNETSTSDIQKTVKPKDVQEPDESVGKDGKK